ncbi:uncharacterized protein angptl8 [Centropristis striata]|uniref:uncharacterized protein angptl8 n=1 Tax=Centropristis striata TaxID=184440 RepID=UPI0027DEAE8F|nr:uncharacterized protein angptl8 [Centropristis striata]
MKMIWGLCLLCLAGGLRAVHAAPVRKTGKMKEKAAPQEEVNTLMFGVIQFSQSLNYVYETTEAKIAQISRTLRSHGETLQNLGKQTEQAAEVEKEIKVVIQLLQAQMVKQQAQTKMTKDWLASMDQEEVELKTKVKKLEVHLNTKISIKELQKRAEEQANILKNLQHLTQFQKENIEAQNEQLSKLQNMSASMT